MQQVKGLLLAVLVGLSLSTGAVELRLYGGSKHDVFLGLLNGQKLDSDSIWNKYGTYGSKYESQCIWNMYGDYGGRYSDTSPFNPYANTPPVIVDIDGNFYGYLTANIYANDRAEFPLAKFVCSTWERANEDLDEVYELALPYMNPTFVAAPSVEDVRRAAELERNRALLARRVAEQRAEQVRLRREVEAERERTRPSEISIASFSFLEEGAAAKPPSRIWTDHKGGKISAKWVALSEDEQTISLVSDKTGKTIRASYFKFSEADQRYIKREIAKFKSQGYVIYKGWWNKPVAKNKSREVKNGGFPSIEIGGE